MSLIKLLKMKKFCGCKNPEYSGSKMEIEILASFKPRHLKELEEIDLTDLKMIVRNIAYNYFLSLSQNN